MDFNLITPSWNYGRFLGDCLGSVAAQGGTSSVHMNRRRPTESRANSACNSDQRMHFYAMSPNFIQRSIPESAAADVAKAVELLAAVPGVIRIWLFGSATGKRVMDARSDLDFAVEGLTPGREYGLWSELDARLSRPLDLVRYEDAPALLLSEIHQGILLYEA